jgi:protein subunit release factor B
MTSKQKLFSVTASDCDWETFRGSGHGGQNRNKRSTAVRCIHRESGATGRASENKSQKANRRLAFKRMSESEKFMKWLQIKIARLTGIEAEAQRYAEKEMNSDRVRVEVKQDGRWVVDE